MGKLLKSSHVVDVWPAPAGSGVLLVDDDFALRCLIAEALRSEGYDVIACVRVIRRSRARALPVRRSQYGWLLRFQVLQ